MLKFKVHKEDVDWTLVSEMMMFWMPEFIVLYIKCHYNTKVSKNVYQYQHYDVIFLCRLSLMNTYVKFREGRE
jgi:hypothetical protein